jgi:pyruvate dehydrogenase E2 component (dihydrolipoamide acetyltransferase)
LASDLGIGLDSLAPGKDGLIHARQVIDAVLEQPDPDLSMSPPGRLRVPTAMESAVARNMFASRQTPVFHLSSLLSLKSLSDAAKTREISLTLALTRACALAIVQNPRFNCLWTSQGIVQRDRIDIGVAVDLGDGLVTPVLRDVAGRPLDELLEDWRILKEKASLGRLVPTDYVGGTFYLSNLGTFPEVFSFDAILPSTSSAILAVASQAGDGKCTLTLTCDHRILYGGHAARFMNTLAHLLGSPEEWIGIPS